MLFIFYLINTLQEVWHNCRICQDSGSMPERNRKTIWRCMSKDEISYQILYRYSLEKLYSTLTRRVDNLLSFALVFLGVGVTINVGSPFILGPGIVGIAILKRVLRFGTRSAQADRQSRAWLKLFNTQHRFPSDKTLFPCLHIA